MGFLFLQTTVDRNRILDTHTHIFIRRCDERRNRTPYTTHATTIITYFATPEEEEEEKNVNQRLRRRGFRNVKTVRTRRELRRPAVRLRDLRRK